MFRSVDRHIAGIKPVNEQRPQTWEHQTLKRCSQTIKIVLIITKLTKITDYCIYYQLKLPPHTHTQRHFIVRQFMFLCYITINFSFQLDSIIQ